MARTMNLLHALLLIQCSVFATSTTTNKASMLSFGSLRGGNSGMKSIENDSKESRNLLELGSLNTARYLGEKELLVIRIEAQDSSTTLSESDLRRDIFESEVNLPNQYEACSRGKLKFKPAQGTNINNGVATIQLDKVVGKMGYTSNDGSVVKEIESKALSLFGRAFRQFDQVMICMPPGVTVVNPQGAVTDKYTAFVPGDKPYAFFLSIYNDEWCTSLSAGMHEVGHNLGLNHAGENMNGIFAQYEDETGMMGYSGRRKDGPLKCFNPAKSWQLGWYAEQSRRINPLLDAPLNTVLTGITRDVNDHDKSKNILIQIPNGSKSIYVGYNQAVGYNVETETDKANKVLVMEQDYGGSNVQLAFSSVLAKLDLTDSYGIENYMGTGKTLIIKFNAKNVDDSEVLLDIYFENERNQRLATAGCNDNQVRLEVNFVTDAYADKRVGWELINDKTKTAVAVHAQTQTEKLSSYEKMVCLDREKDYTFTFKADHGIGICCNGGFGFYSVFVEGEEIFRGGEFGAFKFEGDNSPRVYSVSHKFNTNVGLDIQNVFVTKPPTKAPTQPPTSTMKAPTSDSCVDKPDFRWKSVPQWDCAWVASDANKRCPKEQSGVRIKEHCPKTCNSCDIDTTPNAPVAAPVIPPTNQDSCVDDANYTWKNNARWTCKWVAKKKNKRCSKKRKGKAVKDFCRKSCGNCGGGTSSVAIPVASPTVSPPNVGNSCTDNLNYRWKGIESWNCAWVADDKNRRCERELNGERVKDQCRQTCGTCSSDIAPAPAPAPTAKENDASPPCGDDSTFIWRDNPSWTCAWVALDKDKRCSREKDGYKVEDKCKATCGTCNLFLRNRERS
eukprot:jgi/Psemu1/7912/gm1.7912_g